MARQRAAEIDAEAAAWAARLDRGPLSASEQTRLNQWTATSTRHVGALARARAIHHHFDRAAALGSEFDPETRSRPARRQPATGQSLARNALIAMAAALLLVIGVALLPRAQTLDTGVGELRRVLLDDGTSLTLNTDSRVAIDFGDRRRLLVLERGEILLDVAHDAQRPFVVDSGIVRVHVTGTRFSVFNYPDKSTRVTVIEGEVELRRDQTKDSPPVTLTANTGAISRDGTPTRVTQLPAEETERRLKWLDGMLAFNGQTLAEAATEFSRYSTYRIIVATPEVGRRKVVGLFAANNPSGFAEAVALSFGLHAEPVPGGVRLVDPGRH